MQVVLPLVSYPDATTDHRYASSGSGVPVQISRGMLGRPIRFAACVLELLIDVICYGGNARDG